MIINTITQTFTKTICANFQKYEFSGSATATLEEGDEIEEANRQLFEIVKSGVENEIDLYVKSDHDFPVIYAAFKDAIAKARRLMQRVAQTVTDPDGQ
jgi:hypothetical protein